MLTLYMKAWNMNGKPITPDHGYPLRVIVPGQIGGRSVKVNFSCDRRIKIIHTFSGFGV